MNDKEAAKIIYELNELYLKSKAVRHLPSFWKEINRFETEDDIVKDFLDLFIQFVDNSKLSIKEHEQLRITRAFYEDKNRLKIKLNHVQSAIMLIVCHLHETKLKEYFYEYV